MYETIFSTSSTGRSRKNMVCVVAGYIVIGDLGASGLERLLEVDAVASNEYSIAPPGPVVVVICLVETILTLCYRESNLKQRKEKFD